MKVILYTFLWLIFLAICSYLSFYYFNWVLPVKGSNSKDWIIFIVLSPLNIFLLLSHGIVSIFFIKKRFQYFLFIFISLFYILILISYPITIIKGIWIIKLQTTIGIGYFIFFLFKKNYDQIK